MTRGYTYVSLGISFWGKVSGGWEGGGAGFCPVTIITDLVFYNLVLLIRLELEVPHISH